MNETLLTKEELAVRLNISAYEVDMLRKKQGMPCRKIGRGYRYDLEEVNKFIKNLGNKK